MIVAIGDIHGCMDPLKALMRKLKHLSENFNAEFIFLGDYIDRGPSTKEVLDYLINLKINATFLMGNHEQMLLMYHRGHDLFQKIGNAWFARNNGGLTTVKDLDPKSIIFNDVWEYVTSGNNSSKYKKNEGEFRFEKKYETFFDNMKFAVKREINVKDHHFNIIFSHAVPNNLIPIEEIINCKSYDAFCEIDKKYNISEEWSNLWNKEFLIEPLDNCTVVHGHIPTFKLPDYLKRMRRIYGENRRVEHTTSPIEHLETNFNPEIPHQALFVRHKETKKVLQVDIDTGSVYGGRLSALIIPETTEEAEKFLKRNYYSELSLFYTDNAKGFYEEWKHKQERLPELFFFDHQQ